MIHSAFQLIIGTIVGLVLIVLCLVRSALRDIARDELKAWLPDLARGRVRRVASSLPPEHRDILEAWEAELNDYLDRPVAMLLVALRIARSRRRILAELGAAALVSPEGARRAASPSSVFESFARFGLEERLPRREQVVRWLAASQISLVGIVVLAVPLGTGWITEGWPLVANIFAGGVFEVAAFAWLYGMTRAISFVAGLGVIVGIICAVQTFVD